MLKKNLGLLVIVVLTICLVGFALDHIVPSSAVVQAASEPHPVFSSAGPSEKEAIPLSRSAQPVAVVATGLVVVFFGIIAVSPLLLGDPARALQEANRAEV